MEPTSISRGAPRHQGLDGGGSRWRLSSWLPGLARKSHPTKPTIKTARFSECVATWKRYFIFHLEITWHSIIKN